MEDTEFNFTSLYRPATVASGQQDIPLKNYIINAKLFWSDDGFCGALECGTLLGCYTRGTFFYPDFVHLFEVLIVVSELHPACSVPPS